MDDYETDEWLLNVFEDWFDPCPLFADFNGLEIPWKEHTYVNPPYSNPMPWVIKAIEESKKGCTVVMLLKHDSSTRWFKMLHEHGSKFLLVHGRLKFRTGASAPFPSVLVVV